MVDGYSFSPSGQYTALTGNYTKAEAQEYAMKYPSITKPEVFGMHANADISKDKKEVDTLLGNMLLTQSSDGGGGGGAKSRDDVVGEIALDTTNKVPKGLFITEDVLRAWPITYLESMNTVLK